MTSAIVSKFVFGHKARVPIIIRDAPGRSNFAIIYYEMCAQFTLFHFYRDYLMDDSRWKLNSDKRGYSKESTEPVIEGNFRTLCID